MLVKVFFLTCLVVANGQELNQDWGEQPAATHVLSSAAVSEPNLSSDQLSSGQFGSNGQFESSNQFNQNEFSTPESIVSTPDYSTPSLPIQPQFNQFPSQSFSSNRVYPVKGGYPKKTSPIIQMMQQQKEWIPQQQVQEKFEQPIQQQEQLPIQQQEQIPIQEKVELPVQQAIQEKIEEPVQQQVQLPIQEKIEEPVQQQVQLPVQEKFELPIQQQEQIPIEEKVQVPQQKIVEDYPIKGQKIETPQVQQQVQEQVPFSQEKAYEQEPIKGGYSGYSQQYETASSNIHSESARALNLPAAADGVINAPIDISFSCIGKSYGYYADIENNCQLYHICYKALNTRTNSWEVARASFYCPENTIFDQEKHVCVDKTIALPCYDAAKYIAHTQTRFAPPATWNTFNTPSESSQSSVYATKGGQTSYVPSASTRTEYPSFPVKGKSMQQRSVDGVKGGVKGQSRSIVPEYPTKGGQTRHFEPEYPTKGGQTKSVVPEYPVKGGQQRTVIPEYPTKGGQQRTVIPEYPTKGGQTRSVAPEYPIKGQTRSVVPEYPVKGGQQREFVPEVKGVQQKAQEFPVKGGQSRSIVPEYPVKGGQKSIDYPVKGGNTRASEYPVKGKSITPAPVKGYDSNWSSSGSSSSDFVPSVNMMGTRSFKMNNQLPLSPAMRLGVQKNA